MTAVRPPAGGANAPGARSSTTRPELSQSLVLGDLPLLGALFRSSVRERSLDRFFVFLRCTVLRSPAFEDLKYLSEADPSEARVEDGLPELAPRLIR